MDLFQAIFLGLLQGIFEWLPVSSQGQLMAAATSLFGIQAEAALGHAVFLHLGTALAAIVYFRKDAKEIVRVKDKGTGKFIALALVGSAVTGIPAYLFLKSFIAIGFALMLLIGLGLIATGFLLKRKQAGKQAGRNAGLLTGISQGFSVIPGISRSGVTTSALLMQGFSPEKAFRLSFILSIPSVLIAELGFGFLEGFSFEPNALIALAVAAVVGYASIGLLLRIAKRISFAWFCFGFGLLYVALSFI